MPNREHEISKGAPISPAGMPHRVQRLQEELWGELLGLATSVEGVLRTAVRVLGEGCGDLVAEVRAEEAEVDRREVRIEQACFRVLALLQPVASDFRRVIAALRINRELERLADVAESLAKRAPKVHRDPAAQTYLPGLQALADEFLAMLTQTLGAVHALDADAARDVMRADVRLSRSRRAYTRTLKEALRCRPEGVETWLRLMSSARNLSRAGDHVRKIAAAIVYMKEGAFPPRPLRADAE